MSDLADLTNAAVTWQLILDAVKTQAATARERLDEAMAAGNSLRQQAQDTAGTRMGTVSRTGGELTGEVHDPAALLAWTRAKRPDMITETLDPTWISYLKEAARLYGVAVDPTTGEVIPGVRQVMRPYGMRIVPTRDARRAAREMVDGLVTGELTITAGEDLD